MLRNNLTVEASTVQRNMPFALQYKTVQSTQNWSAMFFYAQTHNSEKTILQGSTVEYHATVPVHSCLRGRALLFGNQLAAWLPPPAATSQLGQLVN